MEERADTDFAARHAVSAIRSAARGLHLALAGTFLDARRAARTLALTRTRAELALLSLELDAAGYPVSLALDAPGEPFEDEPLSEATAGAYVAAWTALAIRTAVRWADAPRGSLAVKLADTDEALDPRLRRAAAVDTVRAYNEEHDELADMALEPHEAAGATWIPAVLKRWDAVLDARVCPTCRAHDGEIVPVGTSFMNGDEPGEVHDYCRCMDTLVFLPAAIPGASATTTDYQDDT
jgi:hypothetical protein